MQYEVEQKHRVDDVPALVARLAARGATLGPPVEQICAPKHSLSPQAIGARAWAWAAPEHLDAYTFGRADREVIAALRARRDMLL